MNLYVIHGSLCKCAIPPWEWDIFWVVLNRWPVNTGTYTITKLWPNLVSMEPPDTMGLVSDWCWTVYINTSSVVWPHLSRLWVMIPSWSTQAPVHKDSQQAHHTECMSYHHFLELPQVPFHAQTVDTNRGQNSFHQWLLPPCANKDLSSTHMQVVTTSPCTSPHKWSYLVCRHLILGVA